MSVMLHHLEDADARPVVVAVEAGVRAMEDEVVIMGVVVDVAEVVSALEPMLLQGKHHTSCLRVSKQHNGRNGRRAIHQKVHRDLTRYLRRITLVIMPTMPKWAKENRTGKMIGTGTWRNGLWYIDQGEITLVVAVGGVEAEILLHHCRLGHLSFGSLSLLYPELFKKAN
ncbi:hypothetical protein VPH35_040178 [Triticum aestivum]|uniref:uncharacterized protein isoform X2 n=1 Tax=Triticum aestivum TaxID=4565 RepID=UPI001ABC682B|nr:uncharacterized protein LOC120973775 isoform X1 [Aegilops tauschii subsp. strangulata]XP_044334534.1 uncharacterized protein LOC123054756 isoform X2 [Triticum aestivum]